MLSVHDTSCLRCLGARLETVIACGTADSRQTCPLHGELNMLDFLYRPADLWNVKVEVSNYVPIQFGPPYGCAEIYGFSNEMIAKYVLLASLLR